MPDWLVGKLADIRGLKERKGRVVGYPTLFRVCRDEVCMIKRLF